MVIAINPYKKLDIYSPEVIAAYQHHNILDLPPHMYVLLVFFQQIKCIYYYCYFNTMHLIILLQL